MLIFGERVLLAGRIVITQFVLLALLLPGFPLPARELRVVVSASAAEEYLEQAGNKSYQTYHVVKGNFFGGKKRDSTLNKEEFEEVAKTAAEFLETRNFFPAANKDLGDQLIMISWGSTHLDVDWNEEMAINKWDFTGINAEAAAAEVPESGTNGSYAPETYQPEVLESQRVGNSYKNLNTRMLGYDKGLYNKTTSPIEKEKLEHDLEKERYFFVLNAFDLPHMRKTNELKQLWSCRVSVRNLGTNFSEALMIMNTVAAPTFGSNLENLMTARVDSEANIIIGEIEVLGIEVE